MSDPKKADDSAVTEAEPGTSEGSKAETASSDAKESAKESVEEPAPGSDVQSEAEGEAAPKKKKRHKERTETPEEDDDELANRPLDAQGRERPLFLTEFPEDPELSRLVAAFEAGNYALIRGDAERLAERTEDVRIRDAALELRRRIDPDPLIKYLLGLAVALLLFLVFYSYYLH
jgi:hypothetical protein